SAGGCASSRAAGGPRQWARRSEQRHAQSARHGSSAGRTISDMRLVVVEFMTLDGVMEAPGFEEHRTGRNGWAMRVSDAELQSFSGRQITGAGALLFGRTTFNIW